MKCQRVGDQYSRLTHEVSICLSPTGARLSILVYATSESNHKIF